MHIGIDTRLTYYRTGGISTYMRRLVSALEALDTENTYTVFQSRKARESLVTRFQIASLWTPCHHRWERLALSAELARFRLDVLHSPDFIPPLHGARRHIITVHDLTFLHYPEYLTADSRHYYNDQIRTAVRQADQILAYSTSTQNDLIQMLDVPAGKITLHTLGVDEQFKILAADYVANERKKMGLPDQYILFVGTIEPRKNIPGLLNAYQELIQAFPDAPTLLLVGKRGWLVDEIIQQMKDSKLGSRLVWREDIRDDQLPAVYNGASVLAMPSFYEGFGFPALEAMACGVVPVVSNRSSLPEVVGDVGLQINPDDSSALANAIERVLSDDHWRAAMKKAGIERAKAFNWHNTASVVRSVYEAI